VRIEPLMYQPTPEGLAVLCSHYSNKYHIDLQCVNLEQLEELTGGENIFENFKCFRTHYLDLLTLNEGESRAIILCYKQYHVIPILIAYEQSKKSYMMVFDSNSGARIKGYFTIANLFPETEFYLNIGTRQADGSSCFTDAVCILKEALQIESLVSLIKEKAETTHRSLQTNPHSRFKSAPLPANFNLFRMPEKLLLTAQRSEYLIEAKADFSVVLRDGLSLKTHHERCRILVKMPGHNTDSVDINSYLFTKAKEHKDVLDHHSQEHQQALSSSWQLTPILTDDTIAHGRIARDLTSPPLIYTAKPSPTLLLSILDVVRPLAGLIVIIALVTENYSAAMAFSCIALTGFFATRLLSEKLKHGSDEKALDELENDYAYIGSFAHQ